MGIGALNVTCQVIDSDGRFRDKHTGRGEDVSPELVIGGLSPEAQTLVVVLEDMSHPIKGFTHWVIWNIPAVSIISEGIAAGKAVSSLSDAVQGRAYGMHRYAGPKPPRGKSHEYAFTVYALGCKLDLPAPAWKRRVLKAARGHILQRGSVCGWHEQRMPLESLRLSAVSLRLVPNEVFDPPRVLDHSNTCIACATCRSIPIL